MAHRGRWRPRHRPAADSGEYPKLGAAAEPGTGSCPRSGSCARGGDHAELEQRGRARPARRVELAGDGGEVTFVQAQGGQTTGRRTSRAPVPPAARPGRAGASARPVPGRRRAACQPGDIRRHQQFQLLALRGRHRVAPRDRVRYARRSAGRGRPAPFEKPLMSMRWHRSGGRDRGPQGSRRRSQLRRHARTSSDSRRESTRSILSRAAELVHFRRANNWRASPASKTATRPLQSASRASPSAQKPRPVPRCPTVEHDADQRLSRAAVGHILDVAARSPWAPTNRRLTPFFISKASGSMRRAAGRMVRRRTRPPARAGAASAAATVGQMDIGFPLRGGHRPEAPGCGGRRSPVQRNNAAIHGRLGRFDAE